MTMDAPDLILYCHCCHGQSGPERPEVLRRLLLGGGTVAATGDLCELAARQGPALVEALAGAGRLRVAACSERAVRALLAFAGLPAQDVDVLNLRHAAPADIDAFARAAARDSLDTDFTLERRGPLVMLRAGSGAVAAAIAAALPELTARGNWVPWFPVIDRSRCTRCRQCAGFCLFGVYAADEAGVRVVKPDGCKTNCPACARICPAGAIIFPKYAHGPINGEPPEAGGPAEPMGVELAKLAGPDVMEQLRRRAAGQNTGVDPK